MQNLYLIRKGKVEYLIRGTKINQTHLFKISFTSLYKNTGAKVLLCLGDEGRLSRKTEEKKISQKVKMVTTFIRMIVSIATCKVIQNSLKQK